MYLGAVHCLILFNLRPPKMCLVNVVSADYLNHHKNHRETGGDNGFWIIYTYYYKEKVILNQSSSKHLLLPLFSLYPPKFGCCVIFINFTSNYARIVFGYELRMCRYYYDSVFLFLQSLSGERKGFVIKIGTNQL